MKPGNTTGEVNLDSFTLAFMEEDPNDDAWNDEGEQVMDNDEVVERMLELIPSNTLELNTFEDEVDNFTSWQTNDRYYVSPWAGEGFDWALFRISWDDNWGRYQWESCARVTGIPEKRTAARAMFSALVKSWGYSPESEQGRKYREFIDQI